MSESLPYVNNKRRMLYEVTLDVVATAMGREPADLIIRNGRLVNVNVARIQDGVDIAVRHGIIAFVGKGDHLMVGDNTKVVDAGGRFLVPGFIDTHDHVESSMVDVRSFAAGILPTGTTTIACDNHELTNVFGVRAVELFHKAAEGLPLKVLVAMPVCVPSIPGYEDAGASITAKEVAQAYEEGWAQVQGEQMNFPGIIYGDPQCHSITAASLKAGVVLTGHYASLELEKGLPAFVASPNNATEPPGWICPRQFRPSLKIRDWIPVSLPWSRMMSHRQPSWSKGILTVWYGMPLSKGCRPCWPSRW
jgi:adenine deaminase